MAQNKYKEWATEENLAQVQRWKRHGLSNEQIAKNMGICEQTFYNWQEKHVEFMEALKKGREVIVCELENALVKRAKGYEVEEKVIYYDKEGNPVERITVKHIPPDTTALIFALKNMDAQNWRDKRDINVGTEKEISSGLHDLSRTLAEARAKRNGV